MPAESGKKIIILHILTILRKYTDINHPMTQQEIADKLLSDYGMVVNRATVKRNIADLMDAGYGIYPKDEINRTFVNKETGEAEVNTICTNFYYEHEFSESELHMLIDGLLFSRSVPYNQRKKLIKKLGELSSSHFSRRMRHVHSMNADSPANKALFYNIEILDEAITDGKQVEIVYGYYGTDLKLHARRNENGTVKKQLLNPYQLVASEGRYYLICNKDNYNNVANYRIDRIMEIRPLETPSKPRSQVAGLEDGLKLEKYLYQHVNMFSGDPEKVEFIVPKSFVSVVIDFFGSYVSFFDTEDGFISCSIEVSLEAMRHWAGQFANVVRVVSPESLVEEIREDLRKANANYGI
ncbi:MAG: WYL domain-containing transcriptional regulator [Clostridia bacterium]|nr:WYL domain-containing transcriptional regulator [Clostridia bacterium]